MNIFVCFSDSIWNTFVGACNIRNVAIPRNWPISSVWDVGIRLQNALSRWLPSGGVWHDEELWVCGCSYFAVVSKPLDCMLPTTRIITISSWQTILALPPIHKSLRRQSNFTLSFAAIIQMQLGFKLCSKERSNRRLYPVSFTLTCFVTTIRRCLHEKSYAGTSFTPGWLLNFVNGPHFSSLIEENY